MKVIALTQGQVATVDDCDYAWLSQWKWYARWKPEMGSFYATRNGIHQGKRVSIQMHREVMGLKYKEPIEVDHVDPGKTLDNRRSNLRLSTREGNNRNTRTRKNNRCGLKGVCWDSRKRKWMAQIYCGKKIHLGGFSTAKDAHEAYREAAKLYHGEFARTV